MYTLPKYVPPSYNIVIVLSTHPTGTFKTTRADTEPKTSLSWAFFLLLFSNFLFVGGAFASFRYFRQLPPAETVSGMQSNVYRTQWDKSATFHDLAEPADERVSFMSLPRVQMP